MYPVLKASLLQVDFVGFAVNPKTAKRNQAVLRSTRAKESKRKMDVPLFRSEKERELENRRKQRKKSELVSSVRTRLSISGGISRHRLTTATYSLMQTITKRRVKPPVQLCPNTTERSRSNTASSVSRISISRECGPCQKVARVRGLDLMAISIYDLVS